MSSVERTSLGLRLCLQYLGLFWDQTKLSTQNCLVHRYFKYRKTLQTHRFRCFLFSELATYLDRSIPVNSQMGYSKSMIPSISYHFCCPMQGSSWIHSMTDHRQASSYCHARGSSSIHHLVSSFQTAFGSLHRASSLARGHWSTGSDDFFRTWRWLRYFAGPCLCASTYPL